MYRMSDIVPYILVPSLATRLIWSLNRFLAAAAKKYYPARIVIVIDGVFAIKVRKESATTWVCLCCSRTLSTLSASQVVASLSQTNLAYIQSKCTKCQRECIRVAMFLTPVATPPSRFLSPSPPRLSMCLVSTSLPVSPREWRCLPELFTGCQQNFRRGLGSSYQR